MPKKHHKLSITIELLALVALLTSMAWLSQLKQADSQPATWQLALPVIASFFVLAGFLSNMYFRWISSAGGKPNMPPRSRLFFWLLALTLFSVWAIAVVRAFWSATV